MALIDDPMPALISSIDQLNPSVLTTGERPADLAQRLPCVVVSRIGGIEIDSVQDVLADRPLVSIDCYAKGLPAAFALMQQLRRTMRQLGARPSSGPIRTPDVDEAAQVRRVTATFTLIVR